MSLAELGNVGEALSGVAVLVSLIYLIVEVRRNTRTVRSNSAWNATVALAELCEVIAPSPQLAELVMRGHDPSTDPEELTPAELNHIGVVVDNLDEAEQRVLGAGFETHNHADYEPGRRFYFNDHDGIEFEVVHYPES